MFRPFLALITLMGGWCILSRPIPAAEPAGQPVATQPAATSPAATGPAATNPAVPSAWYVTKVRIFPASGFTQSLAGARITGSNQGPANGFVELAKIKEAPPEGKWLEVIIPPGPVYRWVKIEAAPNALLAVAEIEFYGEDGKFAGKPFGSASSSKDYPHPAAQASDGNTDTFFKAEIDNAYVGLALGEGCVTRPPGFIPRGGRVSGPVDAKIGFWPAGPKAVYTTDGSTPTRENGQPWDGKPIHIERTTTLAAMASSDGKADSPVATVTYIFGEPGKVEPKIRSYHIGNSLTDTCNAHLAPIAQSAGHDFVYLHKVVLGCSLTYNWRTSGQGFGENDYNKVLKEGVEALFLQPYPNPGGPKKDTDAVLNFTRLARQGNPDVQSWIYAQWVGWEVFDDKGQVKAPYSRPQGGEPGNTTEPGKWIPPIAAKDVKNWDDAMTNANAYYHMVLERARAEDKGAKHPILLCPGGSALVRLEKEIKAGRYPGVKPDDFVPYAFSDYGHLTSAGQYLVSCVHYVCIYKESPEGKAAWATSHCTPEQARILQRIAWETVQAEPDSGVAPTK